MMTKTLPSAGAHLPKSLSNVGEGVHAGASKKADADTVLVASQQGPKAMAN